MNKNLDEKQSIADMIKATTGTARLADVKIQMPPERVIEPSTYLPPFPKQPPIPGHLRLESIRAMSEDELMKWLTTEIEREGRPLDEGTKMAITTELMRRQAEQFKRPVWWKDPYFWLSVIAAVGGAISAEPVVQGWLFLSK